MAESWSLKHKNSVFEGGMAFEQTPRAANRLLDLGLGFAGLVVAMPVAAATAVAMRVCGDAGPLLYRARRVGEDGHAITVYKLRTMYPFASGLRITGSDDARITPIGRVLRKFKLDELPQFLNVLRGEMSVVGPRPEDESYVDWSDPLHRFVFSARPGITGPSQIAFRHEERLLAVADPDLHYRMVVLPQKLRLDAAYLLRRSARTDLGMVVATVRAIFDHG